MTVLTTSQLRQAWAPPKRNKGNAFIDAYRALDDVLRRWGFDAGHGDTGAYNPRPITGGTDWSLHAYGPGDGFTFWFGVRVVTALAVDIDWQNNPYGPVLHTNMPRGMIDEIEAIRTNDGQQVWSWGGDYKKNKDAMHFEIVTTPASLRTGIAGGPPNALVALRMAIAFSRINFHRIGAPDEDTGLKGRTEAISIAQTLLNRWWENMAKMAGRQAPPALVITGWFDGPTRESVANLQRLMGFNEFGTIGPKTWETIDR